MDEENDGGGVPPGCHLEDVKKEFAKPMDVFEGSERVTRWKGSVVSPGPMGSTMSYGPVGCLVVSGRCHNDATTRQAGGGRSVIESPMEDVHPLGSSSVFISRSGLTSNSGFSDG